MSNVLKCLRLAISAVIAALLITASVVEFARVAESNGPQATSR